MSISNFSSSVLLHPPPKLHHAAETRRRLRLRRSRAHNILSGQRRDRPAFATAAPNSTPPPSPPLTSSEFSLLLQSCIHNRQLQQGRRLHSRIREAGFELNRDLLPRLLKLYTVCGRTDDARDLFDKIPHRNLDTYISTSMISGYVRNGNPGEAVTLFIQMLEIKLKPDSHTFSIVVKVSADLGFLQLITQLHSTALKCGCANCLSVENSLINAYGSLGDVYSARKVFDRMATRDVITWSSMVLACSCAEHYAESLILFTRMQLEERIKPNEVTIVLVLPACGFFSSFRYHYVCEMWRARWGLRCVPEHGGGECHSLDVDD